MDGGLPVARIIEKLNAAGVKVTQEQTPKGTKYTLERGDVVEVQYLPDIVSRHLIGRFAAKFDIPARDFWK